MLGRRARMRMQDTTNDLADHVLGQREQIIVGRESRSKSAHGLYQ